jgi:UDP-glucose 4-epimerase
MNILVTGGAGFIGSHITDALIADGHAVFVLDNLTTGRTENINPKADFIKADIRDRSLGEVFGRIRPDVVLHEAAQVSVRNSVDDPVLDADVNVLGSLNLLQNCVRHKVRKVVFASSGGAVYGEQDTFPAPETHPIAPLCPYGAAKRSVELYLGYYRAEFGLDYVALRYSNVYGPRQDPYGEAGVVAIFCEKMISGGDPVINGDGGQTRDFVYVADVVDANLRAVEGGYCGCLNVGTGIETSVNELFDILHSKTGYTGGRVHGPAKPGEQRRSVIDCSLIGSKLGWKPKVSFPDGLGMTVEYFRGKAGI